MQCLATLRRMGGIPWKGSRRGRFDERMGRVRDGVSVRSIVGTRLKSRP